MVPTRKICRTPQGRWRRWGHEKAGAAQAHHQSLRAAEQPRAGPKAARRRPADGIPCGDFSADEGDQGARQVQGRHRADGPRAGLVGEAQQRKR